MIMENKILELLEQKGSVSMNDDIFPLVEKEFEGQVIGAELYELAHQYIYHSCCMGCILPGLP